MVEGVAIDALPYVAEKDSVLSIGYRDAQRE
jgi:hypothetical protein